MFRKPKPLPASRSRLETADGDFVDVDFMPVTPGERSRRVVILSHGLEGHSQRPYMLGMAHALHGVGWDVLSRNLRHCSGEVSCSPYLYHDGEIEDIDMLIRRCEKEGYEQVALVGFSMGGNQTLKYLGQEKDDVPSSVVGAVVFSVPCDLVASAALLSRPSYRPYRLYFMATLQTKIDAIIKQCDAIHGDDLERLWDYSTFDEPFTEPLFSCSTPRAYWEQASSLPVLDRIKVPTLLVNAWDDPFLSTSCYPVRAAEHCRDFYLEIPERGGHTGFVSFNPENRYWSEQRTINFLEEIA